MKATTQKTLKIILLIIVIFLSGFISIKSYELLNFTLGNTLHGAYNSYLYTGNLIDKTSEISSNVTNSISHFKNKILNNIEEDKKLKEKELNLEKAKIKNKLQKTEKARKMHFLIDLIIYFISFIIFIKVFRFLIIPLIDSESLIKKIIVWINGEDKTKTIK